ncbi:MAG: hypothetical protein SFT68_05190, partial [Rickettsiaceae bacterium]|nr:hypothetical protein [Rickettsiaceae bacterium]
MNKILSYYRMIICSICLIFAPNSMANFGVSCVTPITNQYITDAILTDLKSASMYSFVLSLIEIENSPSGCVASDPTSINVYVLNSLAPTGTTYSSGTSSNSTSQTITTGTYYSLGSLTSHPTVAADTNLQNIQLVAGMQGTYLCLAMYTQYGNAPLVCRNSTTTDLSTIVSSPYNYCNTPSACSVSGANNSLLKGGVLGPGYECVKESLDILFFNPQVCYYTNSNVDAVLDSYSSSSITIFSSFFTAMKTLVIAMLTLYVMKVGMEMALSPESFNNVGSIAMIPIKVLVVLYFSIGLPSATDGTTTENGITAYLLPLAVEFSDEMALYFLNKTDQTKLCYFTKDDSYASGYSYYAIWDSLDCRLQVYLGINPILFSDGAINAMQAVGTPAIPA